MQTHLQNLLDKHLKLDKEIRHGEHTTHGDDLHLHELKKQKLRLKEEIERLKLFTDGNKSMSSIKDESFIIRR